MEMGHSMLYILLSGILMITTVFGRTSQNSGPNSIPSVLYMPPYVVRDNQLDLDAHGKDITNHTNNISYIPNPPHFMFYVIFCVNCFTFTLGLVGNSLLLLVYGRNKALRTNTNTYILSIAVTDLLVTLTCASVPILTDLAGTWPFGETTCKLSQTVMEFSTYATVLTLTALSMERYYAVVHPIESHFSTKSMTIIVNITIWIVSCLCSIPKFMNSGIRRHRIDGIQGHTERSYCVINQDKTDIAKYLSLFDFLVFYTIPLCVICVLYACVSRHLMQTTDHAAKSGRMSVGQIRMARMRYKVAKMVIVLSAIFFVGFMPHNILILRLFFLEVADTYWNSAASYAYCYGCLHFWMNPIALYVCCETIRKHFNQHLCCGFCPKKRNKTAPELPVQDLNRRASS
ncbi:neuropeptide CCHamide-2 receptor-like [Homalodisca vitripennis]|uniref:neuropeptide CCHamide-2 receptor-like n=1 Tax=Homalodisca vitripennis TaxID=197043 RepID=UPI001EECA514|nr:neuropeptide CCHamide-2 receptor-like [Homalodisca vitripennis]